MSQVFSTDELAGKNAQQFRHLSISSARSESSETSDENGSLVDSLQPYLNSMKILGLYFKLSCRVAPEPITQVNPAAEHVSGRTSSRSNLLWIYSTSTLIFLWLNWARSFTAFVPNEQFGSVLIVKLMNASYYMLCAFLQTSSYLACRSGNLDRVITRLPVSSSTVAHIRKQVRVRLPVIWLLIISTSAAYAYLTWYDGSSKYASAPFGTYIAVNEQAARVGVCAAVAVLALYVCGAWLWTLTIQNTLAQILAKEYRLLAKQFSKAIDADGVFHGSLRDFRRRHQELGRAVREIDYFIRIGNVGGFVCHMANVVVLLFLLVSYDIPDILVAMAYIFMLVANAIGLLISTFNGVLVNVAAHKLNRRVHDVDILQLDLDDANELAMFQKKLSGERTGFSILNIVLIEKQTILTLLGLLITYFLLMIQMTTRKTTRCCPVANEFNATSIASTSHWSTAAASFLFSSTADTRSFYQATAPTINTTSSM